MARPSAAIPVPASRIRVHGRVVRFAMSQKLPQSVTGTCRAGPAGAGTAIQRADPVTPRRVCGVSASIGSSA